MVPDRLDADGASISRQAREFWQHDWQGSTLMAVGVQDPVSGLPEMHALQAILRGCPAPMRIDSAGHFVQEQGEGIATTAVQYFLQAQNRI